MSPFAPVLHRLHPPRAGSLVFAALVVAWSAWAGFVPVGVHALSVDARVAPTADPVPLAFLTGGRLCTTTLEVGRHVEAGEALATLVDDEARAELDAAEARLAGLTREREALGRRDVGGEAAAEVEAARQGVTEAAGMLAAARADEAHAARDLSHLQLLDGAAAVAAAEREAAEARLERARALRVAAEGTVGLRTASAAAEAYGSVNARSALEEAIARVDRDLAVAAAEADGARARHGRSTLRAPVSGTLAEVSGRGEGAVVDAGEVLATLLPDAALHVVATFPDRVVGRMAAGQPARLRASAYDWIRWGSVPLAVTTVSTLPRDGTVRVELTPVGSTRVPLRAGLVGEVDVELEHATPAALLLRAAGALASG